jgi:hypothetical protein
VIIPIFLKPPVTQAWCIARQVPEAAIAVTG